MSQRTNFGSSSLGPRRVSFVLISSVILLLGVFLPIGLTGRNAQAQINTAGVPLPFLTDEAPMMLGENGFSVLPLLTIGESLTNTTGALNPHSAGTYTPTGILDGMGAYGLDSDTIRVFVNHELSDDQGYAYDVDDGLGGVVNFTGARISYFDLNKTTYEIEDGGLAYNAMYDREYNRVSDVNQLDTPAGSDRFCSAALSEAEQFGAGNGLADTIYFAGEESTPPSHPNGGTEWALDVTNGELWAVPEMGRAAWENLTELDTGTATHVAFLIGDDTAEAPIYLYVGVKNAMGDGSFLDRNGLKDGQLYVWKSDTGEVDPTQFNTSGTLNGTWVAIEVQDVSMAGMPGYDDQGYKNSDTLQAEADTLGGFSFSRPEDVSTNPADGTQAVLASTGRSSVFGGIDTNGTVYIFDLDFADIDNPTATMEILYDGNAGPTQALRSPDNLDWADDGWVYLQEDEAADGLFGDGAVNPHEASIVRIDPATGTLERVAEIDRSAVPTGQTDNDPTNVGAWESSGILDVSALFGEDPGNLLLFDVQAHSLEDGTIADANLVEGGQLALLTYEGPTGVVLTSFNGDQEPAVSLVWLASATVLLVGTLLVMRRRAEA